MQRLAHKGWLGFEHDYVAPIAFVGRLWHGLGPALIICAVGLVVALVRRERADLILVSFVLVYFVDLCTLGSHFDRYVLPLLPPLGALAGRMRALAPVTLLLLVVPLTWSIRDARDADEDRHARRRAQLGRAATSRTGRRSQPTRP